MGPSFWKCKVFCKQYFHLLLPSALIVELWSWLNKFHFGILNNSKLSSYGNIFTSANISSMIQFFKITMQSEECPPGFPLHDLYSSSFSLCPIRLSDWLLFSAFPFSFSHQGHCKGALAKKPLLSPLLEPLLFTQ